MTIRPHFCPLAYTEGSCTYPLTSTPQTFVEYLLPHTVLDMGPQVNLGELTDCSGSQMTTYLDMTCYCLGGCHTLRLSPTLRLTLLQTITPMDSLGSMTTHHGGVQASFPQCPSAHKGGGTHCSHMRAPVHLSCSRKPSACAFLFTDKQGAVGGPRAPAR